MESWANGSRISRENNYNILRMIAAATVMYGHMYVLMGNGAPVLYANEVNSIGFKMLMVLSGYMITQSCIYDSKVSHFVIKRVFRLIPALIFYSLIAIMVIGSIFTVLPISEYFKHGYTWKYLYNILLNPQFNLPGAFESNPYPYAVNGSLWGLPIEVSCYILIYVILKLLCKIRWRKIFFSIFVIGICILQVCHMVYFPMKSCVVWGTNWFQALTLLPYFFIGALYAVTKLKSYCNIQSAFILLIISVLVKSDIYVINEMMAMLIIPYIIISFGECSEPIFAKCFRAMDITYGIYLWGFPVQQMVIKKVIVDAQCNMGINMLFVISFAITVLLSAITWALVEKPASIVMKKILKLV